VWNTSPIFDDFAKAHKEVMDNPRYGVLSKGGMVDWIDVLEQIEINEMEGSMNPSLDYLFEFPVNAVRAKKDGSGYAIEFDRDGSIVGIEGQNLEIPDIEGKQLITVIRTNDGNTLVFGHRKEGTSEINNQVDVVTQPGKYFIIDPRFGGETFYPDNATVETADEKAATIREQFEGRFADGPDKPLDELADADSHEDPEES
jgi:hypothetical protein